jgi:hypothetical protein
VKIFYCGGADGQGAMLAGAIHLCRLPEGQTPTVRAIKQVWQRERREPSAWGSPLFLGMDERGNEVYTLVLGVDPDIGLQAVCHLLKKVADSTCWKFYRIRSQMNLLSRLGCFCLHRLRLTGVGSFLIACGIRPGYGDLTRQVRQVKEWNSFDKT